MVSGRPRAISQTEAATVGSEKPPKVGVEEHILQYLSVVLVLAVLVIQNELVTFIGYLWSALHITHYILTTAPWRRILVKLDKSSFDGVVE